MSNVPDEVSAAIKRQILDVYGYASEAELNADLEAEFPGWLEAHAEYRAQQEAFRAALPRMMERVRQQVPSQLQTWGMPLPDGVELAWREA